MNEAYELLKEGKQIALFKLIRDTFGCDLRTAKAALDSLSTAYEQTRQRQIQEAQEGFLQALQTLLDSGYSSYNLREVVDRGYFEK